MGKEGGWWWWSVRSGVVRATYTRTRVHAHTFGPNYEPPQPPFMSQLFLDRHTQSKSQRVSILTQLDTP